jgi:peptidoglycan hydrolase-like amidase
LPYFNCSRGFTFSAYQRLWRIDTPYLVNNVDIAKCDKFIWHGVGLSWKGAEALAKKWLNYLQIIKWYFPWVKVVSLNN